MSCIQDYPDEMEYVGAMFVGIILTHPLAPQRGAFLCCFFEACLRADSDNYEILRPALRQIMQKYPASEDRLAMERVDNTSRD